MKKAVAKRKKPKVLIPLLLGQKNENIIRIAQWFAQSHTVLLVGFVTIPEGEKLTTGVPDVRKLRKYLMDRIASENIDIRIDVNVAHHPWKQIVSEIQSTPSIDTVVLEWPHQIQELNLDIAEVLDNQICNVAIVKGQFQKTHKSILIPIRGGPYAVEALRMSIAFSKVFDASITIQRIFKTIKQMQTVDPDFKAIKRVLDEMPEIKVQKTITKDTAGAILETGCQNDLVILGTGDSARDASTKFGLITDHVLNNCTSDVIAIKTRISGKPHTPTFSARAISVLVDKWFAENTFDADEFSNLDYLVERKKALGITISLALPSLNEEQTVGDVLRITKTKCMDEKPLLDEIILIDSNSTDRTREIAASYEIPVYINDQVLPGQGKRFGKGEALWKSLYLTKGDIVFWVDTDIKNFSTKFIYGILGPLLFNQKIKFVKGFYKRPITGADGVVLPGGGGRVTELTARPMLNLFFPQLSGIIQPLAGEYGGRREVLERLTFTSGYGVETMLLIDMLEKYRLESIGQVNLEMRVHHNQQLHDLSKMSFAIIQTMLSKLEKRYHVNFLDDINSTMNIIQYDQSQFFLDVNEIEEQIRRPMIEVDEYQKKFKRSP